MAREGEGGEEEEDKGGRDPIQGGLQLQVPASACESLQVAASRTENGDQQVAPFDDCPEIGGSTGGGGGLRRRGALEEHQAHGPCRQERMR